MKISLRILLGYFLIVGLAAYFVLAVFIEEVKPGVREAMEDTLVDTPICWRNWRRRNSPTAASPMAPSPAPCAPMPGGRWMRRSGVSASGRWITASM